MLWGDVGGMAKVCAYWKRGGDSAGPQRKGSGMGECLFLGASVNRGGGIASVTLLASELLCGGLVSFGHKWSLGNDFPPCSSVET